MLDDADRHAEEAVDRAHPLGVAAGQVVVHRDDVDALAVERVQIGGQRGDERLAFAGLHLGDVAAVQHHAADQLHVEVPHVEHAAAGFADDGEGFRQQVVERFAVGDALAELGGLAAQLLVGEGRRSRASSALISSDERAQPLQLALVLGADDLGEDGLDHLDGRFPVGYPAIVAERQQCRLPRPVRLDAGRGEGFNRKDLREQT